MEQTNDFWRTASTALCVIRDRGISTRPELAAVLDLSPAAVADMCEELAKQGLIRNGLYRGGRQLCLTVDGFKQVCHIRLAKNGENNVYQRWTPTYPNRRKGAA